MQTIVFGVSGLASRVLVEMDAFRHTAHVSSGEIPVDGGTGSFSLPCWSFSAPDGMITLGSEVQARVPIYEGYEAVFLSPIDHEGRVLPQCEWGEDEMTFACKSIESRIVDGTLPRWFC